MRYQDFCFGKDTLIYTLDGVFTIKELAEKEGFEIKKSWTLEKIYNNLITSEKGKKFLIDYSTNIGVYKFNSYYK
jgi:hypothetical protein